MNRCPCEDVEDPEFGQRMKKMYMSLHSCDYFSLMFIWSLILTLQGPCDPRREHKTPRPGPRCCGRRASLKTLVPFCLIEPSTGAQSPMRVCGLRVSETKGFAFKSLFPVPPAAALNQRPVESVAIRAPQGVKRLWVPAPGFWFT